MQTIKHFKRLAGHQFAHSIFHDSPRVVYVCIPASLQLSPVLCEGRPQVPGVPRGVVAHSSGSRNHDAFCSKERGMEERMQGRIGYNGPLKEKERLGVGPALIDWCRSRRSPPCPTWSPPPARPGRGPWASFPSGRWCSDGRSYHTDRAPLETNHFLLWLTSSCN